jgi:hypothetical protein
MLECLYGGPGAVPEHPIGVDRATRAEDGGQPVLDVRNGRTGVAQRKGQTYRYAAISWSS